MKPVKSILKAIFISALLVCLSCSAIAADQDILTRTSTSQIYNSQAFNLRVELPLSWRISPSPFSKPGMLQFSAYSPTHFPVIGFIVAPHEEPQQTTPQQKVIKNSEFKSTTEEQGEVMLNGYKAKMGLSRFTDHSTIDIYTLMNFITTDTYDYVITMQGHYNAYSKDRIVFDQVINTLQISPDNLASK